MTASPYGDIYWPLDPAEIGKMSNPKDFGELEQPLRDAIWTMRRDCLAATGGALYCNSGYRTPWMQWLLRHGRVKGHEFDARYPASPRTALPGSSNHQKRKACDLGGTTTALAWCNRNSRRYGLTFPVPGEDWHVERRVPPTVPLIAYPGPTYDHAAQPADTEEADLMAAKDDIIHAVQLDNDTTQKQVAALTKEVDRVAKQIDAAVLLLTAINNKVQAQP